LLKLGMSLTVWLCLFASPPVILSRQQSNASSWSCRERYDPSGGPPRSRTGLEHGGAVDVTCWQGEEGPRIYGCAEPISA